MKHRKYTVEWSLLALGVFVSIISIVADYYSTGCNWFARSGAIVVLFAAIVEFKVASHIYEDIQRAQFLQKQIELPVPLKAKPTKSNSKVSISAHVLLIIGTIIWGYGDLVWS